MLIRNARIPGHPSPTDLRLMHGAIREIGVGLVIGGASLKAPDFFQVVNF